MNQLYLLRHGIAVDPGTPGIEDDDRPLTTKGEKRMHQVARGLKRFGLNPDAIVTSPLPRAHRTAEIVAEVLGITDRLEIADALRSGSSTPEAIRDWLSTRSESNLMIVGHNPTFSELIALLSTGSYSSTFVELSKGGVASLVSIGEGQWQLDWLARPGLLRKLGG